MISAPPAHMTRDLELRQQALQGLRALHQQLSPFKFIVYSEWAQSELIPVE